MGERCNFCELSGPSQKIQPSGTSEWDPVWKDLCRCDYGEDLKVTPSSRWKRGKRRGTDRGEGCVGTEAVSRAMYLPVREPPAARSQREACPRVSLRASRKSHSCQHLGFEFLVSRTVRESMSIVLSLWVCGTLYGSLGRRTQPPNQDSAVRLTRGPLTAAPRGSVFLSAKWGLWPAVHQVVGGGK